MPNPNITTKARYIVNTSKKIVFLGQLFFGLFSLVHFLFWSVSVFSSSGDTMQFFRVMSFATTTTTTYYEKHWANTDQLEGISEKQNGKNYSKLTEQQLLFTLIIKKTYNIIIKWVVDSVYCRPNSIPPPLIIVPPKALYLPIWSSNCVKLNIMLHFHFSRVIAYGFFKQP